MSKSILFVLIFISANTFSQDVAFRQKHFLIERGVAINGYDPVSYFLGKPQKGEIKFNHEGVVYQFVNEANLNLFKKSPTKYEPAFGGWCAYAMGAKAKKVDIDPKNYKIQNGVLFLFYKDFFSNTLDDWNKDEANLKKKADLNWKKLQ